MDERKRDKKIIIDFNPSARTQVELPLEDYDYVNKVIREAAIKFAEEEDKHILIILMGLIRKRLREDPSFAQKLRELLDLDKILRPKKKVKVVSKGRDFVEYELGC